MITLTILGVIIAIIFIIVLWNIGGVLIALADILIAIAIIKLIIWLFKKLFGIGNNNNKGDN